MFCLSPALSLYFSLSVSLSLSLSLSLFGVLKLQFGLLSVCALPVSFLCRPEPPAEPGTPAHSTAGKTPGMLCYHTGKSYVMIKQGTVWWDGDRKENKCESLKGSETESTMKTGRKIGQLSSMRRIKIVRRCRKTERGGRLISKSVWLQNHLHVISHSQTTAELCQPSALCVCVCVCVWDERACTAFLKM